MKNYLDVNRKSWDARTIAHIKSEFYDLDGFKSGKSSLHSLEVEELGNLEGKKLLHLMCHFGLDTLSLARLGAQVTGVDFSGEAIEAARRIAHETGIDARFIQADVLRLNEALDEQFDIVFTSYGVLAWLPDLELWAKQISKRLRPGGFFYFAEIHPFSYMIDDEYEGEDVKIRYPYFGTPEPEEYRNETTYTGDAFGEPGGMLQYEWAHSLDEVLNALISAGLQIDFLHEFPYTVYQAIPLLQKSPDGYYRLPEHLPQIPWLFSLKANK